ncbi:hypothetical protein M885DRAFT_612256 [Pelagophyceae sp. CCMP2097]|nr:hypothetical protein M885DRAFT_612256 [Pelagophyceae sp. CCMP2097]
MRALFVFGSVGSAAGWVEGRFAAFGVEVDRYMDYDAGTEYLEIRSNGLPNHRYDERFKAQTFELTVPVPDVAAARARGQTFGGGAVAADAPIGVAVNGVPILPSFDAAGNDLVLGNPGRPAADRDGCFGFSDDAGAYVYRVSPPCLYGDDRVAYDTLEAAALLGFGEAVQPGASAALSARLAGALRNSPKVVGILADGFVLYGPLDEDGREHDRSTLDECGGKFDAAGGYAYYATTMPPFTIACWGPGAQAAPLREDQAAAHQTPHVAKPACPGGYFAAAILEGSAASSTQRCEACAPGRFALRRGGDACAGVCPVGSHCGAATASVSAAILCPSGRYGDRGGERNGRCAGECPEGYFCPPGTKAAAQHPCGDEARWCPAGAGAPRPAVRGRYTLPANSARPWARPLALYDELAWFEASNRFAGAEGEADGDPRWFEAEATLVRCAVDDWREAGDDNCTRLARLALDVRPTQYAEQACEPGSFCAQGARWLCPPGRYGATPALESPRCTAACPAARYCPDGCVEPIELPAGRYSAATGLAHWRDAALCPPGHYCPAGSTAPVACPAGRYGLEAGLTSQACAPPGEAAAEASVCPAGHVCPAGSVEPRANPCGGHRAAALLLGVERFGGPLAPRPRTAESPFDDAGFGGAVFCPAGSAVPIRARPGWYTVGPASTFGAQSEADTNVRESQVVCDAGHYCVDGARFVCVAGRYGATTGLQTAECSGLCSPGYFCPTGSTRPTEFACGAPELYCPLGSARPRGVGAGNYSTTAVKGFEADDADGAFYVAATAALGATSAFDVRARESVCEPGYFCRGGVRRPCPAGTYGSEFGLFAETCQGPCPPGMFCSEAARWATPVSAGRFCARGGCASARGEGGCAVGYYCPRGSRAATQRPCCDARRHDGTGLLTKYGSGNIDTLEQVLFGPIDGAPAPGFSGDHDGWHQHDLYAARCELLYCPAGAVEPRNVSLGFYATGGNRTTRGGQTRCPALDADRSHRDALLLGTARAPYCPSTTRGDDDRLGENLFDDASGSKVSAAGREPRAWETPLFLGLGHYEWANTFHDEYNSDLSRLQPVPPFPLS